MPRRCASPRNRNAIREPALGAKAHTRLKTRNAAFDMCKTYNTVSMKDLISRDSQRTHFRPYISDKGPNSSGPSAYARRNIVRVMFRIVILLILSLSWICGKAGAIIELDTGEMNV